MNINPKVIDLYHGDTVSSFADVYADGYRGVIHKATEGATFDDAAYGARREEAADSGLMWGAYHFLRPGDPAGQAHRFLDVAKPGDKTEMAADHEDPRVSLAGLIAFLTEIEAGLKRLAVVYSGFLIKEQLVHASADQRAYLARHRLWLAQYGPAAKCPLPWKAPFLWQYTEHGRVRGISGDCDLSSFAGSDADLAAQWAT